MALAFLVPQAALAWGGGSSSGSSVRHTNPPKKTNPAPLPPAQPPEHRHVVSAVSYYVQFHSEDGWFPLADPRQEGRKWLTKVAYAPEVKKLSDTQFEVFGNFKGHIDGEEAAAEVPAVVHFMLEGQGENWKVTSADLYSVSGEKISK